MFKIIRKASKKRIKVLQRKAQKDNRRFKEYTILQNKYHRRRLGKERRLRNRGIKPNLHSKKGEKIIIKVPETFCITQNIEIVLKFIYDNKKSVEYKDVRVIVFDFSNVKTIDDGAATILLSFCYDLKQRPIKIGINYFPKNEEARLFMEQSGFIKYFEGPLAKKKESPNTTIKKGQSKILQKDSALMIHKSMKTIWGEERRNQSLQGMLIELMTNSVNHAYLNNERPKSWYISTKHYIDQNKVEFCFVDNGDGIINTISIKLKDKLFTSNENLLIRAFDGEFRSRTKLANRGRGLIVVKNNHVNMTIKGLKVITNNVFLDFEKGIAMKLRTPFSGTFYSWIIDKTCKQ